MCVWVVGGGVKTAETETGCVRDRQTHRHTNRVIQREREREREKRERETADDIANKQTNSQ